MVTSHLIDTFLHLVKIDTKSDSFSKDHPSTPGQLEAIRWIQEKMKELGLECERLAFGSLVVHVPGSTGRQDLPPVAWAAHVDTAPSANGAVNPQVVAYSSGDIKLPFGDVTIPADSPTLQRLAQSGGGFVITSDGTSLLGADDKAGAAAIMELAYRLKKTEIQHPPLYLFFCTDEEIGRFGEDLPENLMKILEVFWTVDGTTLGTLDTASLRLSRRRITFSSHPEEISCRKRVTLRFRGKAGHPGVSPELWLPAHLAACDVVSTFFQTGGVVSSAGSAGIKELHGNASESVVVLGVDDIELLEKTIEGVLLSHPEIRYDLQAHDSNEPVKHSPHLLPIAELGRTLYYAVPPRTHRGPSGMGMIGPRTISQQDGRTLFIVTAGETSFDDSELMNVVLDGFIERTRKALPNGVNMNVENEVICSSISSPIQARRDVLNPLLEAMDELGLPVNERTISGGTDGGMLNLKFTDLPCPNLGTGAEMLHCEQEHISIQDLESLADLLVRTTVKYASENAGVNPPQ